MDFSNQFRHKNYNNFANNRYNNRFRARVRGRGHSLHASHQRHNWRAIQPQQQASDRFGQPSNSSFTQLQTIKPKYDTLIVELGNSGHQFTEHSLRQLFQQTYGTIKKIWLNGTNNKAFITFYSHMSVDMCVESGNTVVMNGQPLKVYPFQVDAPQEPNSSNGDHSFRLKNLCKSNNLSIKGSFPSKESMQTQFKLPVDRKELFDLIRLNKIDKKKLLDDLINANDIDRQFDILTDALELKESDREKRFRLKNIIEEILNSNGFQCKLHFIGSTINGLGFRDSDIDLFIEMTDKSQQTFEESLCLLKKVQNILRRCLRMYLPNPIPSLRCPLVKLDFKEMQAIKYSKCDALVCDISLSNALAKRNSQLIRLYTQLNPDFHKMCLLLRFWAKTNGFVGSSYMSSYALTHLVLFFFQKQQILPSVDELRQICSPNEQIVINGWNCSFNENSSDYKIEHKSANSLIELLENFFTFYSSFDFSNLIICTKTGSAKHKCQPSTPMDIVSDEDIQELSKESFKLTPIISIEDPFELTHNLCANFNFRTFDKFCEYIIWISKKFNTIFVEKSKEESKNRFQQSNVKDWALSYLCKEWDPTPNGYVFPENFIGFANLNLILNSESNQSSIDLIQTLTNCLIDLTNNWLLNVYQIDSTLLSKWHLFVDHLSPFAEFYIKLRALDDRVIDPITRQEIKELLNEELNGLSFAERETKITEKIHQKFNCEVESCAVIPVHCHFALVMNCRIAFPTVELALIDLKPGFESSKKVMNFLRRLIATAANEDRLLTCPHELIN